MKSKLREHVELLREYMFSASSYRGPEPGSNGVVATMPYLSDPSGGEDAEKQKQAQRVKRKLADKRERLRKMSIWLVQKGEQ
jgi:hypothetical protein